MIISDMHSHTDHSADCKVPSKEMIERAIELGLKYYAITDHHDLDFFADGLDFTVDPKTYFATLEELKTSYQDQITLVKGIEFGLQPHLTEALKSLTETYAFDYIIGSTHVANGKDPYQKNFYDGMTQEEGYRLFFQATLENVKAFDDFDTLGHLDYNIRYWRRDANRKYDYKHYSDVLDAILETLIKKDIALEVNTSGYLQKLEQPNPSYDVLSRYHELGGELLTIGSDAHLSKNIKSYFDLVEEKLKQIGFKSYTIFQKRKPIQIGF